MLKVVIVGMSLLMLGCASTTNKDANKNLFEQALVLQQVKGSQNDQSGSGTMANKPIGETILWQFAPLQYQPSKIQKRELFLWFANIEHYSNNPVVLTLGPDWISSYKRGNILRNMIPRGIVIEQHYDVNLPEHQVRFAFKKTARISMKQGGSYDPASQ
jgi:hypothetical protein